MAEIKTLPTRGDILQVVQQIAARFHPRQVCLETRKLLRARLGLGR